MNCQQFTQHLEDFLDGYVETGTATSMQSHLDNCQSCQVKFQAQQEFRARLRALPVPEPSTNFEDRVLRAAIQAGKLQQTENLTVKRNKQLPLHEKHHRAGFIKGFGTALAAGLALWIIVGVLPVKQSEQLPAAQGVTIAVRQVQTVTLAFQTVSALENARITIRLPENVEIVGYEGKSELAWNTNLKKGDNILKLPIKANALVNGKIVAEILHQNQVKTIGIEIQVKKPEITMEPFGLKVV